MLSIGVFSAIAASCFTTLGPFIAVKAVRSMPTIVFVVFRTLIAAFLLTLVTTAVVGIPESNWENLILTLVSAVIGINFGEYCVFNCIRIMGARMGSILYALNAPFAAMLGFAVLGEEYSYAHVLGITAIFFGVFIAITQRNKNAGSVDRVVGPLWMGVLFGLGAALAQAAGIVLMKPVLQSGTDTLIATQLRTVFSAAGFSILFLVPAFRLQVTGATLSQQRLPFLSALAGMGANFSILYALDFANAGIVAALSSLAPVFLLPAQWLIWKEPLRFWYWLSAGLVVTGIWSLVL